MLGLKIEMEKKSIGEFILVVIREEKVFNEPGYISFVVKKK